MANPGGGSLLSGFMQGFGLRLTQMQDQKREDEERKLRVKLYDLQLQKLGKEQKKADKQEAAREELMKRLRSGGTTGIDELEHAAALANGLDPKESWGRRVQPGDPPLPFAGGQPNPLYQGEQPLPPRKQIGLLDMLADPEVQRLALEAGVMGFGDLMPKPETGDVAVLRALQKDPELAAVDMARRRAGASQVNVGEGGFKVPPGYRLKPGDPSQVEPIPGGPVVSELRVNKAQALAAVEDAESSLDRLATEASDLASSPSLWRITGPAALVPSVPGSEAANLAAKLETLKSQTAFTVLAAMRAASKTGGALGSISERELELLMTNLAALDQKQDTASFKKSLQKIVDFRDETKKRLRKAYGASFSGEATPTIDFNSLPP